MSRCSRIENGIFWHSVDANPRVGRLISWFFQVPNRRVMRTFVSRKGSVYRVCVDVRLSQECARKNGFLVIRPESVGGDIGATSQIGPVSTDSH